MLRKKPDCGAVGLLRAGGGCAGGVASPPNIVGCVFYGMVSPKSNPYLLERRRAHLLHEHGQIILVLAPV